MSKTIKNSATLNYNHNGKTYKAVSNVSEISLDGPLTLMVSTLEPTYKLHDTLTYYITLENSSGQAITGVKITDNQATFTKSVDSLSNVNITPLTYTGPAKELHNGKYYDEADLEDFNDHLYIEIDEIPAKSFVDIEFKVKTNAYTPTTGITKKVTVKADGLSEELEYITPTLYMADYADIYIEKTMSPSSILDNDDIKYTFEIYNYGTDEATSITLTDVFNPVPTIKSVKLDGYTTTDYSLTDNTFVMPRAISLFPINISAATISTDDQTGIVKITPAKRVIEIFGTI